MQDKRSSQSDEDNEDNLVDVTYWSKQLLETPAFVVPRDWIDVAVKQAVNRRQTDAQSERQRQESSGHAPLVNKWLSHLDSEPGVEPQIEDARFDTDSLAYGREFTGAWQRCSPGDDTERKVTALVNQDELIATLDRSDDIFFGTAKIISAAIGRATHEESDVREILSKYAACFLHIQRELENDDELPDELNEDSYETAASNKGKEAFRERLKDHWHQRAAELLDATLTRLDLPRSVPMLILPHTSREIEGWKQAIFGKQAPDFSELFAQFAKPDELPKFPWST